MTSTGKLIALIPARSGSKRVPGKNIRELAGHPLIAYTIQVAKDSGLFGEHIYVSSDSEEYLEIAEGYGARGIPRPKDLARDIDSDDLWIKHANDFLNMQGVVFTDFFILRPTSPFRDGATLRRAYSQYKAEMCNFLKALSAVKERPEKMWSIHQLTWHESAYRPITATPYMSGGAHLKSSSTFSELYKQDSSLEIRSSSVIWEDMPSPFFSLAREGFSIDYGDDFILAEALIERGLATLPEIK